MKLIDSIHDKNKVPLLVGGSMMYFNLLKNGLSNILWKDILCDKNSGANSKFGLRMEYCKMAFLGVFQKFEKIVLC